MFDVTEDPHLTVDLLPSCPELADRMRGHLDEWWTFYAGRPGALPDPMLTTLRHGPALYNDPHVYAQHLRDTGRAHLADDLEQRIAVASGTVPVSWHASMSGRHAISFFTPEGPRRPVVPGPGSSRAPR